jgi:hypothetical protein
MQTCSSYSPNRPDVPNTNVKHPPGNPTGPCRCSCKFVPGIPPIFAQGTSHSRRRKKLSTNHAAGKFLPQRIFRKSYLQRGIFLAMKVSPILSIDKIATNRPDLVSMICRVRNRPGDRRLGSGNLSTRVSQADCEMGSSEEQERKSTQQQPWWRCSKAIPTNFQMPQRGTRLDSSLCSLE